MSLLVRSITYLYNDDDRILSETLDRQSNSSIDQTTSYTWNGTQQQSKTVSIPATSTVAQTFSYNVQGMLASVVTENRNASNAVTSRTKVDYGYTTQGIRSVSVDWGDSNLNGTFEMGEKTGSTEYLIDGNNHTGYAQTIAETTKNAAGLATKRIVYTYGTDEINQTVSLIDPSTQAITQTSTVTFTHDAHSSVRALTDAAGAIAQVYIYAAYGELIAIHNRIAQSVGTVGDPSLQAQALTTLLYNGEAFDSRIGQLYLRARWYSASNGRFDRLDPFAGNQNDPLSFNKYGFVHGNPVMGTDPTGLTTMGNVMAGIGIGARLVGSFARVAFMGPAAFTRVGLLSVRLSTLYRAGTFGFAGVNSLVLAIKMIRAVSDGQSVKKAFGSSVDDLLAWYPWWYTGKSFETFQSPESLIRQYKTLINSQTIVPPELLASVLLAELTHYNAIDSAGDGFTRGENSIGVAQIRGDTILRQAKNHPDIWPAFYRNDENLNEIENQLWDSGMAIGFLSLSIRVYARNANIELWRWGVMSEPEREALVARMTNAKDQISDYPVQSVGSDFGGVWGISAYRRIKQGDLLR